MRATLAEFLGTGLLAATALGAVHSADLMAEGNGVLTLLPPSLAVSAMLVVLISVLGPVSGGHINPGVTLMFRLRGQISTPRAGLYIAAQLLGAISGAIAVNAMFDLPLIEAAQTARNGAGQWLSEAIATASLILVISGGLAHSPARIPAYVGLLTLAGYWFTASTGFTNPAVTLARAFSDTAGGMSLGDVPAFVAVQMAAVLVTTPFAHWLFGAKP